MKTNYSTELELLLNKVRADYPGCTIEPLIYIGVVAGSEFLTYNAKKLYISIDMELSGFDGAVGAAANYEAEFRNSADTACYRYSNLMVYWNTTAAGARFVNNLYSIKNLLFSRAVYTSTLFLTHIKFIGYKITIP